MAILFELKKQMRKSQPGINDETLSKHQNKFKGMIKLFFIMVYFTTIWGVRGFINILWATGVVTSQHMYISSKAYTVFINLFSIFGMTPCFVNITLYGLGTKQFRHELQGVINNK